MNTLGLEHISQRQWLCSVSGEAQTARVVGATGVKAFRCVEWEELALTEHLLCLRRCSERLGWDPWGARKSRLGESIECLAKDVGF